MAPYLRVQLIVNLTREITFVLWTHKSKHKFCKISIARSEIYNLYFNKQRI